MAAFPYEVERAWQDNDPFCEIEFDCRYLKEMFEAIEYAWDRGAFVVASAGNGYGMAPLIPFCFEPAGHPRVLCVGATDFEDRHTYYSNYDVANANLVVAPSGADVTGGPLSSTGTAPCEQRIAAPALSGKTFPCQEGLPGSYRYISGTSSSTALTAGVAALLSAQGLTNEEIMETIMGTARDLGVPGPDPIFGSGQVDAAAAVGAVDGVSTP